MATWLCGGRLTYLGQGSKAVGRARGVGNDDISGWVVLVLVDAHHVHGGVVGGGCDDDALSTTLEMGGGLRGCVQVAPLVLWGCASVCVQKDNNNSIGTLMNERSLDRGKRIILPTGS